MFANLLNELDSPAAPPALVALPPLAGGAAPVAAHVGRGRGGARGRSGGRGRGFGHSEATRAKISSGMRRKATETAINRTANRTDTAAANMIRKVLSPCSAYDSTKQAARQQQNVIEMMDGVIALPTRSEKTFTCDRDRCLISHVRAQAQAVGDFVSSCSSGSANRKPHMVTTVVFDDAEMWVSRPKADDAVKGLADHATASAAKKLKKKAPKGRMTRIPVLNSCEIISSSSPVAHGRGVALRACSPHSPAQCLPKANFATVANRLEAWTFAGARPGSRVDPLKVASSAFENSSIWRSAVFVKDCLPLNNNVIAKFENQFRNPRSLADEDDQDAISTVWHMNCQGHSGCLVTGPLYSIHSDLEGFIVRIGHLSQASRPWKRICTAIELEFLESWDYRKVLNMPAEYVEWRRHAEEVLELSKASRDLSEEQQAEILQYDNGNWKERKVIHYCIRGCPCKGTEAGAKQCTLNAIKTCVANGCKLALKYRWKNMDQAKAFCYRSNALHQFLLRSLKRAFDRKAIDDALLQLANSPEESDKSSAKQTVKASFCIDFLSTPDGPRKLRFSMILDGPAQDYINQCLASESLHHKLMRNALGNTVEDAANSQAIVDLQDKVFTIKFEIISGRAGEHVVKKYLAMLTSFEHPTWTKLGCARDEQYDCSLLICRAIGLAERRLVQYFDQGKFDIFEVGASDCTLQDIVRIATDTERKRSHCSSCVDLTTAVWVSRLLKFPLQAARALRSQLLVTPMTSGTVEKKHPLGQESRKVRSRGLAINPDELERRTYQKSVALDCKTRTQEVMDAVVPRSDKVNFGRFMTSNALNKRGITDTHKAARAMLSRRRMTLNNASALSCYSKVKWNPAVKPCTPAAEDEKKRLYEEFHNLTDVERSHYEGMALSVSRARKRSVENLDEGLAPENAGTGHGAKKRKTLQYHRYLENIQNHSSWEAGLGISCPSMGLVPKLADLTSSREKVASDVAKCFKHDPEINANPTVMTQPEQCCSLKHSGICSKDLEIGQCSNLAKLVHQHVRANGISKKSLPLLCMFGDRTDSICEYYLLLDLYGHGELQMCLQMFAVSGPAGSETYAAKDENNDPIVLSSHRIFRRLCRRAQAFSHGSRQYAFRFTAYNTKDARLREFALTKTGVKFTVLLNSGVAKANLPKVVSSVVLPFGMNYESIMSIGQTSDHLLGKHGKTKDVTALSSDSDKDDKHSDDGLFSETESSDNEAAAVGPAAKPLLPIGIFNVEWGTGLAKCHFCKLAIGKKEVRYDYRFKASTTLSDRPRIHATCAGEIPREQHEACAKTLREFVNTHALAEPLKTQALATIFDFTH